MDELTGRLHVLASLVKNDETKATLKDAAREITRLRDWIRREGEMENTCTFNVLNEICKGCGCGRLAHSANGEPK